jgi:hypothetical protein
MAPHTSNHRPRRYERGGVSWVTLLLLATLAGSVYLVITWAPVYVVHYEVKQTVRDFMNQAIKNSDDAVLIEKLCEKVRSLDSTTVVFEDGRTEKAPSVNLTPSDVTWERDSSVTPPTLRVAFQYTREVHYPYLEKASEWVGTVDLFKEIGVPDWGPSR